MIHKDAGSVWATIITGAQFPAHVLRALCGQHHPLYAFAPSGCQESTSFYTPLSSLWGTLSRSKLHPPSYLFFGLGAAHAQGPCTGAQFTYWRKSLWALLPLQAPTAPPLTNLWGALIRSKSCLHSSLFAGPATVHPCTRPKFHFSEKSLWVPPASPNKHVAFHTDQLSGQSRVYQGHYQSQSILSPSFRCCLAPQFLWYCPSQWPLHQLVCSTCSVSLTAFLSPLWLYHPGLSWHGLVTSPLWEGREPLGSYHWPGSPPMLLLQCGLRHKAQGPSQQPTKPP